MPSPFITAGLFLAKLRTARRESASQFKKLFVRQLFDGLLDLIQCHADKP